MNKKLVANFEMPMMHHPKSQFTVNHTLGRDVVYAIYDEATNIQAVPHEVECGDNYIRVRMSPSDKGKYRLVLIA